MTRQPTQTCGFEEKEDKGPEKKRFHVEYCPECEHPVWDDAAICPNCKFEGKMCKFKPDKWSEAIY